MKFYWSRMKYKTGMNRPLLEVPGPSSVMNQIFFRCPCQNLWICPKWKLLNSSRLNIIINGDIKAIHLVFKTHRVSLNKEIGWKSYTGCPIKCCIHIFVRLHILSLKCNFLRQIWTHPFDITYSSVQTRSVGQLINTRNIMPHGILGIVFFDGPQRCLHRAVSNTYIKLVGPNLMK